MPLFDIQCEECGNIDERFFTSHDEYERSSLSCSRCGSDKVSRVYTNPANFKIYGYSYKNEYEVNNVYKDTEAFKKGEIQK